MSSLTPGTRQMLLSASNMMKKLNRKMGSPQEIIK